MSAAPLGIESIEDTPLGLESVEGIKSRELSSILILSDCPTGLNRECVSSPAENDTSPTQEVDYIPLG